MLIIVEIEDDPLWEDYNKEVTEEITKRASIAAASTQYKITRISEKGVGKEKYQAIRTGIQMLI